MGVQLDRVAAHGRVRGEALPGCPLTALASGYRQPACRRGR
jgi:hypothetical protein